MKNLLISVSGGRSSALMAWHINRSPKYKDYKKLFAFANTGQEKDETIYFLKSMVKYWDIDLVLIEGVYSVEPGVGVRHRIVSNFDYLDRDSNVFRAAIAYANKNKWTGVPNQAIPYCSEYLKRRPLRSLAREIFNGEPYITALGYRKEDMPARVTYAELREMPSMIAPLLTDFSEPVDILFLDDFFHFQPFQLGISSDLGNCELCYKKSDKNIVKAIRHGVRPETITFYEDMENEYGNTFFRGTRKVEHFIKHAAGPRQLEMFDASNNENCSCGLSI